MNNDEKQTNKILDKSFSRRDLLKLGGCGAIMLGLGSGMRLVDGETAVIRPPGAYPEDDFIGRCIRCQKCLQVCPTDAIQPVFVAESIVSAGTPQLDFSQGECTFCMDCVNICPTGMLQPIAEDEAVLGLAEIDRQECIAWNWTGCTVCYDVCPYEAIVLDEHQRPNVLADKCNGCGLCQNQCPSATFRSYSGNVGKLGIMVYPLNATSQKLAEELSSLILLNNEKQEAA